MKTKPTLLPRLVFGLVLVVVPAAADAPPDQYVPFDRTATEITDQFTSLTWSRAVNRGSTPDVPGAATYCSSLGSGWAVPTVKELLTIVDEEPHQEYDGRAIVSKMIDANAFPSTPVDKPFWTSTPAGPGTYWAVSFATGVTQPLPSNSTGAAYVRCVR